MSPIPIYDYKCQTPECGHIEDDLRKIERREDPLPCPKCEGPMVYYIATGNPPVGIIKESKTLTIPGRGKFRRSRHRVLGTKIGLIRPVEIGNAMHDLEQKYGKDIDKAEQAEIARQDAAAKRQQKLIKVGE